MFLLGLLLMSFKEPPIFVSDRWHITVAFVFFLLSINCRKLSLLLLNQHKKLSTVAVAQF